MNSNESITVSTLSSENFDLIINISKDHNFLLECTSSNCKLYNFKNYTIFGKVLALLIKKYIESYFDIDEQFSLMINMGSFGTHSLELENILLSNIFSLETHSEMTKYTLNDYKCKFYISSKIESYKTYWIRIEIYHSQLHLEKTCIIDIDTNDSMNLYNQLSQFIRIKEIRITDTSNKNNILNQNFENSLIILENKAELCQVNTINTKLKINYLLDLNDNFFNYTHLIHLAIKINIMQCNKLIKYLQSNTSLTKLHLEIHGDETHTLVGLSLNKNSTHIKNILDAIDETNIINFSLTVFFSFNKNNIITTFINNNTSLEKFNFRSPYTNNFILPIHNTTLKNLCIDTPYIYTTYENLITFLSKPINKMKATGVIIIEQYNNIDSSNFNLYAIKYYESPMYRLITLLSHKYYYDQSMLLLSNSYSTQYHHSYFHNLYLYNMSLYERSRTLNGKLYFLHH